MIIKRCYSTILLVILCSPLHALGAEVSTTNWGPVICGAQLSIQLSDTNGVAATNCHLEVSFRIRNVSQETLGLLETMPAQDYSLALTNSRGSRIPLKIIPDNAEEFMRTTVRIKPSETVEVRANLWDFYDPPAPGRYSLRAKRIVFQSGGKHCEIESNVVVFELAAAH